VYGDQGRLRQVLLSLVDNGLKFTKTGSIRTCVSNEEIRENGIVIRFEVIDSGIGIPEERVHQIFQTFSQIDSSLSRAYGGIGLGLAICKRLVELMCGTIGVNSDVGKGTTFWFCIPLKCSPEILETVRH
jgi:signal transduction histidine kinase